MLLLDMNFKASINTGNEGIYWLKRIKELQPSVAVIMITAYGDIDLAVRSLKEGAADFIVKPWHNEKLLVTIEDALKAKGLAKTKSSLPLKDSVLGKELLGSSEVMQDIFYKVDYSVIKKVPLLMQRKTGWVVLKVQTRALYSLMKLAI